MIIKYIWHDSPETRTFNTEKAFRNNPEIFTDENNNTQEKYDKIQLEHFERDKKRGLVLDYWCES